MLLWFVRDFLSVIGGFFKFHVSKFLGIKDFATLQALDKLCVFVPGDDFNLRVFANGCHRFGFS